MTSISVVIPSYNSSGTISKTLESLLNDPDPLLEEVVVVDSSDDLQTRVEIEKHRTTQLRTIYLPKKTIPATARNLGAKEAKGDILAFIDSDAFPAERWLPNIEKARREGCRSGGGPLYLPDFQRGKMLAAAQYFLQFNEFLPAGRRREKTFVPSCNFFCEKALFEEAGGFPEMRASEDVLLGIRINKISPVYFVPEIGIYHIFRESVKAYLKNQVLLGEYIIAYRRLVYDRLIYKGFLPVVLLPGFLLVKFCRIAARIFQTGQPKMIILFLASFPYFFLGFIFWGAGFFKGCFQKTGSGDLP